MKILSTEVLTGISDGWGFVCVILLLLGIASIFVILYGVSEAEPDVIIVGFLLAVVGFGLVTIISSDRSYEYEQHKALVKDFEELHDKGYEIIEQEGEIFTIQLKGADEQ